MVANKTPKSTLPPTKSNEAQASSQPTSRSHKIFDKRWFIACTLLIVAIVVGIVVNFASKDNGPTDTTGLVSVDNGDLKVNWSRYSTTDITLEDSVTITDSGIYHLTGTLADGSVTINSGTTGEVKLILDNISITNSIGPAISCISGDDLVIELVGESTLVDGAKYSTSLDEDIKGTIYSKADLTFEGDGTLKVTANYQDAIVGKDDVKFNSGTYDITAVDDGIRGKDSVYIVNGNYNITSGADAIKSTNDTDSTKGFVLIESGNITISAGDDAIHAEHVFTIEDGSINITKSYEGLEAQKLIINGGNISIVASDDGINAGGGSDSSSPSSPFQADENCEIIINNGDIYINASGDGVDSNGWVYFNGGNVAVDGPVNNGNGALDAGAGIAMNGGTVIAVGSSGMAESLGNTSSVYNVSIYFSTAQNAGVTLEIKDAAGSTIVSHTAAKSFSHAAIGSTEFSLGSTYSVYLNGTKYQDFTISDTVTTVGSTNSNTNMMLGPGKR